MSVFSRLSDLAVEIRDTFNKVFPRLLPKGGREGQVLAKSSDADFAVKWTDGGAAGGRGWAPIRVIATGSEQEITLPESDLSVGDVLVFVSGIFQHSGFVIEGDKLKTIQPAGFEIMIVRYGVGEKGADGTGGGITGPIEIEDVEGLPQALSGKADVAHQHTIQEITGLRSELDGLAAKVQVSDPSAFEWIATESQDTWYVQHNLGRYPTVLVVDASGMQVFGTNVYNDSNNITIHFSHPVTGTAYLAGTIVSGPRSFEWSPPSATTLWEITHNLGRYPTVTVIDSAGTQFQGEVTYTDINSLTISFAYATGGRAYLT